MIIPASNSVRLVDDVSKLLINQKHPTIEPKHFFQRVANSDNVRFVLILNNNTESVYTLAGLRIRNLKTNIPANAVYELNEYVVGDYLFLAFNIDVSLVSLGVYRIEVEIDINGTVTEYSFNSDFVGNGATVGAIVPVGNFNYDDNGLAVNAGLGRFTTVFEGDWILNCGIYTLGSVYYETTPISYVLSGLVVGKSYRITSAININQDVSGFVDEWGVVITGLQATPISKAYTGGSSGETGLNYVYEFTASATSHSIDFDPYYEFTDTHPNISISITALKLEDTTVAIGSSYNLISESLYIAPEHEYTNLITYRPNTDESNLAFDSYWSESMYNEIRIESGVNPENIQQLTDDRLTEVENKTYRIISSDIYEVEKWTFGNALGIPSWLAKTLNIALSCGYLAINGVRYAKNEGASLERLENTGFLSPYEVELKKYDSILSEEINPDTGDGGSFDDSFDNSFEI